MRDRMYEFPSWLWTIYSRLWIRIVMLPLTTTALGNKRASNKNKIKQWMIMMIMIMIMLKILIINTFCCKKKNSGHEVVMISKQFGCCGWGHIHTKADRSCAGTKIIPDRISVHISNGDFDAISVTERSCAHASPSIKWSVPYLIDFFPSLSLKLLQIFLKVSPKFFKNLRRVTFKCTASLKWHFYFYNWTFWDENPLRPKAFSLWTTRGLRSMVWK